MSKGAGTARGRGPARVRDSEDPGRLVADAGLTLLELCITVALLGIALAALVGSIASASSLSDRAAAKTESEAYGRRIAEIIRDPKFPTYLCGIDTLPARYTTRVNAVLGAPTTTTTTAGNTTTTTAATTTTMPNPGGGGTTTTAPQPGAGTTTTTRPTTTTISTTTSTSTTTTSTSTTTSTTTTTLAPTTTSTSTTTTTAPNTTNADLSFAVTDVRWTVDPAHSGANPENWTAISCSSSDGADGQPVVQSNITVMIWVQIDVWPTNEPNYVTTVSVLKRGLTS